MVSVVRYDKIIEVSDMIGASLIVMVQMVHQRYRKKFIGSNAQGGKISTLSCYYH